VGKQEILLLTFERSTGARLRLLSNKYNPQRSAIESGKKTCIIAITTLQSKWYIYILLI